MADPPELTVQWLSSGAVLGRFRAAELDVCDAVSVGAVKRRLVPLVHQPRFKLKLLRGSDVLKNEEELTLPEALQLVVLSRYQQMTREQMIYVLDVARRDVAAEMEQFLQLPMDPDVSADGDTALHCAAASGSVGCCRLLLEARANLELPSARYNDHRPLQVACQAGELEIVQLLLAARADQHQAPPALHLASYHGAADMVRLLLAQRGRADELDREQDATPLRLACQQNHLEVVRSLLEAKATANKACEDGSTPLPLERPLRKTSTSSMAQKEFQSPQSMPPARAVAKVAKHLGIHRKLYSLFLGVSLKYETLVK
ncbi:unnamed protein product [Cladocopium goreaui]|uniref:Ankyrin repeat domain-containing protein 50 n=1 Tax=Cladocopium goreaui TaxID=2562237 RepID=A0A9P1CI08_9DINO|nr:unnamed protein product [Cladocopium goreaui]